MQLLSKELNKNRCKNSANNKDISIFLTQELTNILAGMMERSDDIEGAMVSSSDGIAWAEKLKVDLDQHRFAAMSGALLALSDNLISEGRKGSIENALIQGSGGNIFLLHAGKNLLLTVFTNSKSNLGMSLAHAKHTIEKIEYLLASNS